MKKILLIDPYPLFHAGFRKILEGEIELFLVAEALDEADGLRLMQRVQPDIVVVGSTLAGFNGLEISAKILSEDCQAKILLCHDEDQEFLPASFEATGIRGFIHKRSPAKSYVEALHALARGGRYFDLGGSAPVAGALGFGLDSLSPRELSIFRLLAEGHAVESIALSLNSCVNTVGVHKTRLMRKLGVSNTVHLAHVGLRAGVIRLQEPAPGNSSKPEAAAVKKMPTPKSRKTRHASSKAAIAVLSP